MTDLPDKRPDSEILIYQTEDGCTRIQVRLENETVWLTQADMAQLFQTTPQNITLHLKNIFNEGELSEAATCKDFLQVQIEGGRRVQRTRKYYNLDAIISVGYRIKSFHHSDAESTEKNFKRIDERNIGGCRNVLATFYGPKTM